MNVHFGLIFGEKWHRTGSSLGLCLAACVLVLWQPAAASSGIPGLIAYLNGTQPIGGTSPLTGKKTGFLSIQTLLAKTIGMVRFLAFAQHFA